MRPRHAFIAAFLALTTACEPHRQCHAVGEELNEGGAGRPITDYGAGGTLDIDCEVFYGSLLVQADVDLTTLTEIEGDLTITNLASIHEVRFPVLEKVHGEIYLANLSALEVMEFPALTQASDVYFFSVGPADPITFPTLETVTGDFQVNDLAATDLRAPSLTTIGRGLTVEKSPNLAQFSLNALTSTEFIVVHENTSLVQFAMPAFVSSIDTIAFIDNPALPTCAVYDWLASFDAPGVSIRGNNDIATCP